MSLLKRRATALSLDPSMMRTGRDSATVIGGKLLVFLCSFILITGLANLVPKEVVGSYNYLMATLAIVSITTLPGMGVALVRAVSKGRDGSLRFMVRYRLLFGMIGTAVAMGIGGWYLIHGNIPLGWTFIAAAPFVPLTDTLSEMAFSYFQGKKRFGKSVLLSVVYQALFSLPAVAVLFLTDRLIIIAVTFFSFQAIAGWIVYRSIRPENDERDTESERFGMHLTVMQAFRIIGANADRLIAWQLFGPLTLAIYTFAATPISKLEQLIPIEMLALPSLVTKETTAETKRQLLRKTALLFILIIPPLAVLYAATPFIYHLLFPTFGQSIPLFRSLLLIPLLAPFTLLRTALTAWRRQRLLYIIEIASPVVKILLCISFGYFWGIWGFIGALVASKAFDSLLVAIMFIAYH